MSITVSTKVTIDNYLLMMQIIKARGITKYQFIQEAIVKAIEKEESEGETIDSETKQTRQAVLKIITER